MSTSLLYHAFGIRGYDYLSTAYEGGQVRFTIGQRPHTRRCPVCGSRNVAPRGHQQRTFRTVPIGRKPVTITLAIPRVACPTCDLIRQVPLDFADPRRSYTRAFERYALELCRLMTIQDVAQHLEVGWDTIKDIQKRDLQRRFGKPRLSKLKQIAIDEIAIGQGHRYLTVVLNLQTGAVVFVGDGKGADALEPFWRRLRAARAKIEAVATDMSPAYIQAVRDAPGRRRACVRPLPRHQAVQREAERLPPRVAPRGHRQAAQGRAQGHPLAAPEEPREPGPQDGRSVSGLEEALQLNQPLATVYYMKEDLRQIWEQPDKATAAQVLDDWIRRAEASCIKMLQKFAATLAMHRTRHPGLLRLPHLDGAPGRNQQQDPDHATASLRLPRSRVLQAEDPGHPRGQVRISRMNPFSCRSRARGWVPFACRLPDVTEMPAR